MKRTLPALLLLSFSLVAIAAGVEPRAFDRPEQEARYRALIAELRCLVCQNQTLAESDAELARDLRDQTYEMIQAGRSDDEIVEFMVGRYGDFVLYRPPVTVTTALLWFGPAVLVTLGAVLALIAFALVLTTNAHPISLGVKNGVTGLERHFDALVSSLLKGSR